MEDNEKKITVWIGLVKEVFSLLNQFISIILLLGIAGSVYAVVKKNWILLIVGIFSILVLLTVHFFFLRRDKKRYGKPKKYFKINKLHVTLCYTNENETKSYRWEEMEVVPLMDDLVFFPDTIIWDGKGVVYYTTDIPGHSVKEYRFLSGIGYRINFGKTIPKKIPITTKVNCLLCDYGQTSRKSLVKEIRYPTSNFLLQVILPADTPPRTVIFRTYTNLSAHWSYDQEGSFDTNTDGTHIIAFKIARPILNRCYAIEWTN